MRTGYSICALVFVICGHIERLAGCSTERWASSLVGAVVLALLAIAWRPTSTITLNGVQSVTRSSDGKTSTWQIETALPPEGER